MELCSDGHDEVCFDSRHCPVCAAMNEISNLDDTINELNDEIDNLKEEIDNG